MISSQQEINSARKYAPPPGITTLGLHNPCWDYGGSDHLEGMYLQPPPAHTGMMVVWGGGGGKERGWGALCPFLRYCPVPSSALALQGVCSSPVRLWGGSRGVSSPSAAGSSPTVGGCTALHEKPRLGQQQKNGYKCGGFEQPTPKKWG